MKHDIKIAVFGLGFVGLTTAIGFANHGFTTYGYEILSEKVLQLQQGCIPFFEKDLEENLENVLHKTLFITNKLQEALLDTDIIFYCIGTPMDKDGNANLSYICEALRQTSANIGLCKKQPILIIKSTVPPSSSQEIFIPFLHQSGIDVNQDSKSQAFLINNPEFLREGHAYHDFMNPDRIIIGTNNQSYLERVKTVYKPFNAPMFFTTLNSAEFIKYLSNTLLATNISFANEMSMIAQTIGDIDIKQSFQILHRDKRFHGSPSGITNYIYPGLGFGGYCLPKDTLALSKKASEKGLETNILNSVLKTNEKILDYYITKIQNEVTIDQKIIILGLSFKPLSDDVRDSKSATLIQKLLDMGYHNIYAYDPIATENFKATYSLPISYTKHLDETIKNDQCLIIVATAWPEFKQIHFNENQKILDLRFYL